MISIESSDAQPAQDASGGNEPVKAASLPETEPAARSYSAFEQSANSLDAIAVAYVIVLNSLAETVNGHIVRMAPEAARLSPEHCVREARAAAWAAVRAALRSSSFGDETRKLILSCLAQRLLLLWHELSVATGNQADWLEGRSEYYLNDRISGSPIDTAARIVIALFDAIGISKSDYEVETQSLISLFAHRIISDVYHFDDLSSRFRFE